MSESKRARQPARTPQEKLEDAFFDMTVPEQERLLASFSSLHRMKRRLFGTIPKLADAWGATNPQGSLIDEKSEEPADAKK